MKAQGSTLELRSKLLVLSPEEGCGITGVEVKFVEIGKNTCGEGGNLARD